MHRLSFLVPIAAGLAAAMGQAPWGWWWLALPAFALGIWSIAGARRPFVAGLLFGTAHFALALHWIVEPFLIDPAVTGWLAPVALLGMAAGFGLFWAVAGWAGMRLFRGPLGVALALAGVELLRSYLFTGFPWALPGHVLIASPALPAASLAGAHGLGLAVLLGAGLVAGRTVPRVAGGVLLWLLPLALGAALPPAPLARADAPVLRLIQPNAPQHLKWDPEFSYGFFRRGLEETAAPPTGRAPDAVIWPETALPELLRFSDDLRPVLSAAAGGVPVVIGAQRYGDDGRPRNSLVMLTGDGGAIATVHDKYRLVPFGEFLPMPGLFEAIGIGPLAAQLAGGYAAGDGPVLIDVPGVGDVLPLICYEAIFPQEVRRTGRPRAILHLTNDAWFGTDAGPQQHLALAQLRAAESGLPLFRAANTGVSAAIDARGRVLSFLPLGEAGHLDAALPPALPVTPYVITGDWAVLALLLALAAGLFMRGRSNPVVPRAERP
ncbi:apolipoprotein N-acyltransferase [Jannaschia rubra]|uniref:Apolipoprotein N-acyltransferase n=1 Tax=Jannaschia rubra TaxID=282197 RepID=A0A0M6XRW0_9RHOB|nr:apolipoprotein N-acyltransferase [Jannaschia rubra]CTQ33869.1 Apolipoprotein N-acyltransferase [Jannaschia rubra]SFG11286.1 Apolipoprotein N-acyltransferase [Jannaschia rubra]